MPDKPTDRKPLKPRNKRERADKWYVDGLFKVQEGRCPHCGEPLREDMQVAHVQLRSEGLGTQVDVNRPRNIVLACLSCNNKHKKKTMPVPYLPQDFCERLAGFLLTTLEPKLGAERAARADGTGCTILTSKMTENTEVIDWQHSDFGLSTGLLCTITRTVDAEAVLLGFLAEAARSDGGPILPNGSEGDRAKTEMRTTINAIGPPRWLATARFWLRGKFYCWPNGNPKWDSFGEFAFNFGVFDKMRVKAERAAAAQRERDRIALERIRAEQAAAEAEYQVKRAADDALLEERKAAFRERLAAIEVTEDFSENEIRQVTRGRESLRNECNESGSLRELEELEWRLVAWLTHLRDSQIERQFAEADTTGSAASAAGDIDFGDGSEGESLPDSESDTGSKPS